MATTVSRKTRHSVSGRKASNVSIEETGIFWNGKFWPKEPNEVIGRRMGAVKCTNSHVLADSERILEILWMEDTQEDIWSIIYKKNMDQIDQSIALDEQLTYLRQSRELGRLRAFTFEDSLPKDIVKRRHDCERRRRMCADLMEAIMQRSIKIREKRRSYVINSQEDDLIGTLIYNPLHEKNEKMGLGSLAEEDESNGTMTATIGRRRRKDKNTKAKLRPKSTFAPSLTDSLTVINSYTDEIIDALQSIEAIDQISSNTISSYVEFTSTAILFSHILIMAGEDLIFGTRLIPAQNEQKKKEASVAVKEYTSALKGLISNIKKLNSVFKSALVATHHLNESRDVLERLRESANSFASQVKASALEVHRTTDAFTNVVLSAEVIPTK